jgi:FSR family fosmidomycin resistance protein-like MFS transporter
MGAFVFNFTMPVTLLAILSVMPKNKGLSFGLTSAALFIGSLPTILGKDMWLKNNSVVFSFILMSAIVLFAVLISIQKNNALKD